MRWPRMTVRRWSAVVAILALSMGGVRLLQDRAHHLRMAAYNGRWEAIYVTTETGWEDRLAALQAELDPGDPSAVRQMSEARQSIQGASTMKALFARRRQISERLASHPWESAPPDPLARKADPEGPFLLFEPRPGLAYEFSTRSAAGLALAPIVGVCGYVAFRLARRRTVGLIIADR